jgi:hypothetical protein
MKQSFLVTKDNHVRRAVQLQIMSENTLDTILRITEKYDTANYATGIYIHPESKQIGSNAIA